jgi:hypothetical protein
MNLNALSSAQFYKLLGDLLESEQGPKQRRALARRIRGEITKSFSDGKEYGQSSHEVRSLVKREVHAAVQSAVHTVASNRDILATKLHALGQKHQALEERAGWLRHISERDERNLRRRAERRREELREALAQTIKLTAWFERSYLPARPGWYEYVHVAAGERDPRFQLPLGRLWWDGELFHAVSSKGRKRLFHGGRLLPGMWWRGLAEPV